MIPRIVDVRYLKAYELEVRLSDSTGAVLHL